MVGVCFDRFDGYEVLGDRISISWYKDVRKARAYGKMIEFSEKEQAVTTQSGF